MSKTTMNPDSACVLFSICVTLSLKKKVLKQAETILLLDMTKCII